MNELGEFIKKRREEYLKVSLRELARRTEISHSYISQLEKGIKDNPKPIVLRSLAQALDVPYPKLMELAGQEIYLSELWEELNKNSISQITVEIPHIRKTIDKRGGEVIEVVSDEELKKRLFDLKHYLKLDVPLYYDEKLLTDEDRTKIQQLIDTLMS